MWLESGKKYVLRSVLCFSVIFPKKNFELTGSQNYKLIHLQYYIQIKSFLVEIDSKVKISNLISLIFFKI